jgi:hypothetical protein
MENISGTPRKLTIAGTTFKVPGDFNATMNFSPFETEGIATSGGTMFKMTLRVPTGEGINLICNDDEETLLNNIAQRRDNYSIAVTLASGKTMVTTGKINYENLETEENRASIILIPDRSINAWKKF